MGLPNRPAPVSGGMAPNDPWTDPEFKSECPSLYSFLYDPTYSDGTARATGSMSIFVKFSVLTAAINDNARGVTAFVNATTWTELLFKIDQGIKEDSLPWRRKGPNGNTNSPPF